MAKSQLFKPPMQWIYTHGGVFPIRRGFADDDAFVTAVTILDRGDTMAMYAEGGRSRTGELSKKPRRGIGRPALLSGAPDRPRGDHRLLARAQLEAAAVPEVKVHYGHPLAYERVEAPTRDQEQAAADAIFAEVRALYERGQRRRLPRPERRPRRAACRGPAGPAARPRRAPRRRPRSRSSCRR